jgi:hypothetical protein
MRLMLAQPGYFVAISSYFKGRVNTGPHGPFNYPDF